MKIFKKLILTTLILTLSLSLVSCLGSIKPDDAALALVNIAVKGDVSQASKLKISKDEAQKIYDQYTDLNDLDLGIKMTTEQKEDFRTALLAKLKDCSFRTEVVSETKDTAVVKIFVTPIDLTTVLKECCTNAFKDVSLANINSFDPEEALVAELIPALKNAKILERETDVEVTLKKEKNTWVPLYSHEFDDVAEACLSDDGIDELMDEVLADLYDKLMNELN